MIKPEATTVQENTLAMYRAKIDWLSEIAIPKNSQAK
jgi:hypothetical protein